MVSPDRYERRNKFPQFNGIRKFVRNELARRKRDVPTETVMPFIRFTSGRSFKYQFFHIGLHNSPDEISAVEQSYGNEDVVGYAYSGGSRVRVSTQTIGIGVGGSGRHPVPGITSAQVVHLGVNEPIKVTVNWKCYNTTQLEFLRQMFGLAGTYVMLDFGQTDSRGNVPSTFSYGELGASALGDFVRYGRNYIIEQLVYPSGGNYDFYIGQITNYEMSINSDGSYDCFTEFLSVGEAVFGVSNHKHLKYKSVSQEEEDDEIYTIYDYFDPKTKKFENLLGRADDAGQVVNLGINSDQVTANLNANITPEQRKTEKGKQARDRILARYAEGVEGRYVSWNFLLKEIIPDIFSNVIVEGTAARKEISLLKNINSRPVSDQSVVDDEPLVGDNEWLASTNISVIIVKERLLKDAGPKFNVPTDPTDPSSVLFGPRGLKSDEGTGGYLSRGVWLNVELIRDAFLTHNTFYDAIQNILTRMNNATVGFWKLSLVFDEDDGYYKVIDKNLVGKSISMIRNLPTYIFNMGSFGELLSLRFNSSFSKEMKTALYLSSRIPSEVKPNSNFFLTTNWRSIPGPDIYGPVLNWSEYPDVVDNAVTAQTMARSGQFVAGKSRDDNIPGKSTLSSADDGVLLKPESQEATFLLFDETLKYFVTTQSKLIEDLYQSGLKEKTPNPLVAPVPTEMTLELSMRGIGGLSFFDVFGVAKLPAIYMNHGVFAINGIEHTIDTERGWITNIEGFFYFCYVEGITDIGSADDEDRITEAQVAEAVRRRSDPLGGIDSSEILSRGSGVLPD